MGKYQQECDYLGMIASQADEIERLNAQVAMMDDALAGMLSASDEEEDEEAWYIAVRSASLARLRNTVTWLAAHDAKVRDDALETCALNLSAYAISRGLADEIRSMKGKS